MANERRVRDDGPAAGEIRPRVRMGMGTADSGAGDVTASVWDAKRTQAGVSGRVLSDSERSGKAA